MEKTFVASGIRQDLLLSDRTHGKSYLREVVEHHVSGQLKVAPEHTEDDVLSRMRKPGAASLLELKALFDRFSREAGKAQFLTYYLIAAHPGCTGKHMNRLKSFCTQKLRINPEQVQIFVPTPSTYSSLMYWTEIDPFTGEPVFVEKEPRRKEAQKSVVVRKRKRT